MTSGPSSIALVYPSSAHGTDRELRRAVDHLRASVPDADVLEWFDRTVDDIAARDPDTLGRVTVGVTLADPAPLVLVAGRMRWIQMVTTGIDHVATDVLASAGVRLTTAAGTSAPEIGEFVVARLLEHLKRLPEIADQQRRQRWEPAFGTSLGSVRVVLVGYGAINRRVAALLAPFGTRVTAVRRSAARSQGDGVEVVGVELLDDLLPDADVVVAAVPATDSTRAMFDERRFSLMRPGAFFCNVGRGSAVVEPALIAAIESGRLSGAAIDVTATEPLPAGDPLWTSAVRISPHSSSVPPSALARVLELVAVNMARYRSGGRLLNEVELRAAAAGDSSLSST